MSDTSRHSIQQRQAEKSFLIRRRRHDYLICDVVTQWCRQIFVGILWILGCGFLIQTEAFSALSPWQQMPTRRHMQQRACSSPVSISRSSPPSTTAQLFAKALKVSIDPWYPLPAINAVSYDKDEQDNHSKQRQKIEDQSIQLAANLIRKRLNNLRAPEGDEKKEEEEDENSPSLTDGTQSSRIKALVENRFLDLACNEKGERLLEGLFAGPGVEDEHNDHVIRGAIMAVQSLCVFATQVGIKGTPEYLQRLVAHLDPRRNPSLIERDLFQAWDADSVRRLKYRVDRVAAVQLLAELQWKRTLSGAFDLLVALRIWEPHEDVALLRSGFPLRFSRDEVDAAKMRAHQVQTCPDPEEILGIRKDLRHLKVYTIDGVSTSEIDDGLSVERITRTNKDTQQEETIHRMWVHIADAERLAPPGSDLFEIGRKRITSLYLPQGSISMFPPLVCTDLMPLRSNRDACALSLSVEIDPDGSIDESSIEIVPSLIHVTYRLSYEEVDEMLQEGIAYSEEWALGVWLDVATIRREYRKGNGSSEALIPNPIPYSSVTTYPDKNAPDGVGISIKVEVSHNAGRNQTLENGLGTASSNRVLDNTMPASSSFLLVTEAMIVAGEALGRWKRIAEREAQKGQSLSSSDGTAAAAAAVVPPKIPNRLRLPYRTQPPPDYRSRANEKRIMNDLLEYNVGDGLCYSWYARRFLLPVKVTEIPLPHSGLGLDCYVQWTSPIRRYSDLQVHSAVKRFLRRNQLNKLLEKGLPIPSGLTPVDLGISSDAWNGSQKSHIICTEEDLDSDINYFEGAGLIAASRFLQRQSQQYWLFQYIERMFKNDNDHTYHAVVLGCVDPEKQQYAIYVYELGLEHRYLSPRQLDPGIKLRLKVQSVHPRNGLLTFVRVF